MFYKAGNISENSGNAKANLKRKLNASGIHHYSINLSAGDILHIKAEQYGIDLIAKVSTVAINLLSSLIRQMVS